MNATELLQALLNGILLGGVYGGIGMGLSLVLGVLRLVNLAHSAILIFGALIYWQLVSAWDIDPFLAIPPVLVLAYLFGLLLHRGVVQHILRDSDSTVLLAFFGAMVVIESVAIMIWTTDPRTVDLGYLAGVIALGPIRIPVARLVAALLAAVVLVVLHFFLTRTLTGAAIRGMSENPDVASMVGIDVPRLSRRVFALGAALAAFGGIALTLVASVSPQEHLRWLAWAFLVVVLGGLGSALRTLLAGILVGVVETLVGILLPFQYTYLVLYALLAVALLVRSEGLGGAKQRIL